MSDSLRIEKQGDRLWLVFPDDLVKRLNLKEGDRIDSTIIEGVLAAARPGAQKQV